MNPEDIVAIWSANAKIAVPYFAGAEVGLFFENEREVREYAPALIAFLSLTVSDRDAASHHAYAFFRDFADDVGFEDGWIDMEMQAIIGPGPAIWKFVWPSEISACRSWDVGDRDAERIYVVIEANCGWEEEHGLQMCFRDGTDLVKLSACDGHATNGHAYDDLSKDRFVYSAVSPEWNTVNPEYPD